MRKYKRYTLIIMTVGLFTIMLGSIPANAYTIYFESDRDGEATIYRVDGDDAVAVTESGCGHPSVTSDNRILMYNRIEETLWGRFWTAFYVINDTEYRLTRNEIYDEFDPVISRNGSFAAYTTMRAGNLEIITVPMNQNELHYRITENGKPDELPALASSGSWIYWTGRTGNHSYLFRAPGREGDTERISDMAMVWEEHPSISANGRYIAYAAIDLTEDTGEEEEEEEIDEDEMEEEEVYRPEGNCDIWVLDTITGNRTRLTTDPGWDGNPCISSNGNVIVFTSDRDGNYEIYMINRNGTGLTRLTDNEATDDFAAIN